MLRTDILIDDFDAAVNGTGATWNIEDYTELIAERALCLNDNHCAAQVLLDVPDYDLVPVCWIGFVIAVWASASVFCARIGNNSSEFFAFNERAM